MNRLLLLSILLTGCGHFKAKQYHTAAVSPPSVQPVRTSIGNASRQSAETSRQIGDIRKGTDKVDRKAMRALEFFPRKGDNNP